MQWRSRLLGGNRHQCGGIFPTAEENPDWHITHQMTRDCFLNRSAGNSRGYVWTCFGAAKMEIPIFRKAGVSTFPNEMMSRREHEHVFEQRAWLGHCAEQQVTGNCLCRN